MCQKTLICGHVCKEFCSKACPPCKEQCQTQCIHSKCDKPCGEPCTPCKEACLWSCQHYKCSKLCSEPCDRPKCNEPCPEMLECEHPCIGLCGEACPKLCRICHQTQVTEIFFGNEDDPSARFVVLDCQHIVEVESMDQWMETKHETENEIGLKKCPKCSTIIRKTPRYKSVINAVLSDIEQIKEKAFGHVNQAEKLRILLELFRKLQVQNNHFCDNLVQYMKLYHSRLDRLENESSCETRFMRFIQEKPLSEGQYASLENLIKFAQKVYTRRSYFVKDKINFCETQRKALMGWLHMMSSKCFSISLQQCTDFCHELERLRIWQNLCRIKIQLSDIYKGNKCNEILNALDRIENWMKILRDAKKFDEQVRQDLQEDFKAIKQMLPDEGLGITEDEKIQIVQAMQLKQGHWFKCPKGHIYVITECGGAMEESKCSECGAKIGGGHHRLVADNQLATEMDGATAPAWPSALMQ